MLRCSLLLLASLLVTMSCRESLLLLVFWSNLTGAVGHTLGCVGEVLLCSLLLLAPLWKTMSCCESLLLLVSK